MSYIKFTADIDKLDVSANNTFKKYFIRGNDVKNHFNVLLNNASIPKSEPCFDYYLFCLYNINCGVSNYLWNKIMLLETALRSKIMQDQLIKIKDYNENKETFVVEEHSYQGTIDKKNARKIFLKLHKKLKEKNVNILNVSNNVKDGHKVLFINLLRSCTKDSTLYGNTNKIVEDVKDKICESIFFKPDKLNILIDCLRNMPKRTVQNILLPPNIENKTFHDLIDLVKYILQDERADYCSILFPKKSIDIQSNNIINILNFIREIRNKIAHHNFYIDAGYTFEHMVASLLCGKYGKFTNIDRNVYQFWSKKRSIHSDHRNGIDNDIRQRYGLFHEFKLDVLQSIAGKPLELLDTFLNRSKDLLFSNETFINFFRLECNGQSKEEILNIIRLDYNKNKPYIKFNNDKTKITYYLYDYVGRLTDKIINFMGLDISICNSLKKNNCNIQVLDT